MSLAWAFFKRDALIALSYRATLVAGLVGNLFLLGVFYFIGKLIDGSASPALAPYGGSYLAFMLIGLALTDCVGVSLTTFAGQIREGQLTGTLEATLMSPAPLPVILLCSSLWSYAFSGFRFLLYMVVGGALYGVSWRSADPAAAVTIFALTVASFAGVGILWASVVILVKRGEAILSTVGLVVILLSGVVFPRSLLPGWLQRAAELVPLTHALDGMRLALLHGDGLRAQAGTVATLGAFAVALLALGFAAFGAAVDLAKRTGSLVEY